MFKKSDDIRRDNHAASTPGSDKAPAHEKEEKPETGVASKGIALAVGVGSLSYAFGVVQASEYTAALLNATHPLAEIVTKMHYPYLYLGAHMSLFAALEMFFEKKPMIMDTKTLFTAASIGMCAGAVDNVYLTLATRADTLHAPPSGYIKLVQAPAANDATSIRVPIIT